MALWRLPDLILESPDAPPAAPAAAAPGSTPEEPDPELEAAREAYREKRERRIERLHARADRAEAESRSAHAASERIGSAIPFGQPILVGHHSERRHRRDLERIDNYDRKAWAKGNEAKTLHRRAHAAEQNRSISSDDPDAIPRYQAKLAKLEKDRAMMVMANKAARSSTPRENLAKLGFPDRLIDELLKPEFGNRVGFPSYVLTNNSAECRRIKAKIKILEERRSTPPPPPLELPGVRVFEEENRVRIVFDAKPDKAMCKTLRGAGFWFTRRLMAWERFASPDAWYEARYALGAPNETPSRDVGATALPPPAAEPAGDGAFATGMPLLTAVSEDGGDRVAHETVPGGPGDTLVGVDP